MAAGMGLQLCFFYQPERCCKLMRITLLPNPFGDVLMDNSSIDEAIVFRYEKDTNSGDPRLASNAGLR